MGHTEDRWMKTGPTGRKVKTDRHGKGQRWLAVWTEPGGRRRKQAFATKDAAEAHLSTVAHQQRSGTYISPERGQITVRELAAMWREEQTHQRTSSLATVDRRLTHTILPELGDHTIADVGRATIQAAVNTWSKTLAPSTVKLAYTYTAGMFKLAVRDRRIHATPCVSINLPSPQDLPVIPATVEQVQALIEHLWTPYKPLAVFIAATGLRGGEARGLEWNRVRDHDHGADITIDRQLVTTKPSWGPLKTKSSIRTLRIGPATRAAMGERGTCLVFTTARGTPINRNQMSEAWRHAAPPAGMPGDGWHALRHFHASKLIAGGASPVAVAARLGHKDATETLQTYAHLWHDDDERMAAATDGLVVLPAPTQPPAEQARRSEA